MPLNSPCGFELRMEVGCQDNGQSFASTGSREPVWRPHAERCVNAVQLEWPVHPHPQPRHLEEPHLARLPMEVLRVTVYCLARQDVDSLLRQVRCASCQWRRTVDETLFLRQLAGNSFRRRGGEWAANINTASRRILRAGRSLAFWVALDCVLFPLLLLLRVCGLSLPIDAVFFPTWLALGMSLRICWTSSRARQAVLRALDMQSGTRSRRPLLDVRKTAVHESKTLNMLHFAASLPLPLTHLSYLCHHFLEGCLLSLMPSEILSVVTTWTLLRRRCKCHAVFGMITSVYLIFEWCFFPACVLPFTLQINPIMAVLWLLPVTMPYVLLCCFAFSAGAFSLAASIAITFFSVVCLHLSLAGAGMAFSSLCCALLLVAGCALAVYIWRMADRRASISTPQVDGVFARVASILE